MTFFCSFSSSSGESSLVLHLYGSGARIVLMIIGVVKLLDSSNDCSIVGPFFLVLLCLTFASLLVVFVLILLLSIRWGPFCRVLDSSCHVSCIWPLSVWWCSLFGFVMRCGVFVGLYCRWVLASLLLWLLFLRVHWGLGMIACLFFVCLCFCFCFCCYFLSGFLGVL